MTNPTTVELNSPPVLMEEKMVSTNGVPPGMPSLGGEHTGSNMSTDDVSAVLAKATASPIPVIEESPDNMVDLPAGWITPEGEVIQRAVVRELNGYDEERLARLNMFKNVPAYVTEMLDLAVLDVGGVKPDKEMLREMLIGDREALMIGIRQVTYGNLVDFNLKCDDCDTESKVEVEIDKDVPVVRLEDPLIREWDVELKNGRTAKVKMINGRTQEAFSDNIGKKTGPEINSIMLSKSVISIDGVPTAGKKDVVQRLSAADRNTLADFLAERQPGPQFNKPVMVPCATCGKEYPITLGLPALFRI